MFQPEPMTTSENPSVVRSAISRLYAGNVANHGPLPELIRQYEYVHAIQVIGAIPYLLDLADNSIDGYHLRVYTLLRILYDFTKVCLQVHNCKFVIINPVLNVHTRFALHEQIICSENY